jgi:AAA domain
MVTKKWKEKGLIGSEDPSFLYLAIRDPDKSETLLKGLREASMGTRQVLLGHCLDPELEPWDDLEEAELPELKIILDGILNQGAKMTLGGSSKAGKTWLLMDLAFSIATGRDWLGIKTHKGKVLYVNFEIQKQFFRKRGQSIRRAKGIPPKEKIPNLRTWTLRGKFMTAEDFKNAILKKIGNEKFDVIIVDPLYKLLNGEEANSAGVMQKILAELEQISTRAEAALIYADHFSKGNQAAKKAIDRIGGSGVTARDPDAILTFTEHKDEGCLILEFTLRNFKPVKSVVVSKVNGSCIFERRPELNVHDFAKPGAQKQFTADQLLMHLPIDGLDGNAWYTIVEENTGMSKPTFKNLRTELKERGDIELIRRDGKQVWVKTESCRDREKESEHDDGPFE